jgi:hypothetical protein
MKIAGVHASMGQNVLVNKLDSGIHIGCPCYSSGFGSALYLV